MKIEQALVGPTISPFKENFLKKWDLKEYTDPDKPAIFFEVWNGSRQAIIDHRSDRILFPQNYVDYLSFVEDRSTKNLERVFLVVPSGKTDFIPKNYKAKCFMPEIKDFSRFKPNVLGDKIYYHSGCDPNHPQCMKTIDKIQERIDYELITCRFDKVHDYLSESDLKEKFYDKCFLSLNFTRGGGMCTTIELALMGRKTIIGDPRGRERSRRNYSTPKYSGDQVDWERHDFYNYPSFIKYESFDDIINKINEEAKKIGTIQPAMNPHKVGAEWLDMEFWHSDKYEITTDDSKAPEIDPLPKGWIDPAAINYPPKV